MATLLTWITYSNQYKGNDAEFVEFVSEMNRGEVDAVFFLDVNPAYEYYNGEAIKDALKKVRLKSILCRS